MEEAFHNLNQALLAALDHHASQPCFRVRRGGRYQDVSYGRFRRLVLRLARSFRRLGIAEGERVAILARNSPEWMLTYQAALLAGGITVPLRPSLPPDGLRFLLNDCGARLAVAEDAEQSFLLEEAGKGLPELETVLFVHHPTAGPEHQLAELLAEPLGPGEEDAVRRQALALAPDALAAIHYTSSEPGRPLGALFDHARRLAAMRNLAAWWRFADDELAYTALSWGYVPSLDASLYYFLSGVPNALGEVRGKAFEEVQQLSPTLLVTFPSALERFYAELISSEIQQLPESSQETFYWALATARQVRQAGTEAPPELRERSARADLTFFSKIRGRIGGRFRRFFSTGAPLPGPLAESVEALGFELHDLYTVTEAGGFPATSPPRGLRAGSCGRAAPGFELRLAGDGEVLVRGTTVMRGYWRQAEATRQVLAPDGWLLTGDLGRFDADGNLYLTGRKQPVFLLSTGRKVVPARLEERLVQSPFVAQAVVFGEGRPYVTAFLVPDLEALADHFQAAEPASVLTAEATSLCWYWKIDPATGEPITTTAHPRVKELLDRVVAEVNRPLDEAERIQDYALLGQELGGMASLGGEELGQLRFLVAERYAAQIDAMYPPQLPSPMREITRIQIGPERLRELLEKESVLDAWMADAGIEFLFQVARQKNVDAPSLVHLCDLAARVAQMENEEKPLSTALVVGDPVRIARVLPPSQIQLLHHDHIRRMGSRLVAMTRLVDGQVLAYVVDKHGYVRGIHRLSLELAEDSQSLLGPQFRRHALISARCDAMVFFVPAGGRQVRVFADGQLIGRYTNGDWAPEGVSKVAEVVAGLAAEGRYAAPLVERLLRCAFRMSEENQGAIFILGDADAVLARSDAPEISHFAWIASADVTELSDADLANFARQDGATLIDEQGRFRSCMVLLRPDAATPADIGPGKGARHSSAAKMSAETGCLAITVSQDGPITLYDRGQRVLTF